MFRPAILIMAVATCLLSGAANGADAPTATAIKVHGLFADNMVLQRGVPIAVYGKAGPGLVQVSLEQDSATAQVDADGRWRVVLPARQAGGPYTLSVAGADKTIKIINIMVGEVWICSGQSNMEMSLSRVTDGQAEVAAAGNKDLRLFAMRQVASEKPLDDVGGKWSSCTPEAVKDFSAVAYYFGRDLQRRLKVPVGIINASWGGTVAEAWTSVDTLNANPILAPVLRRYRPELTDHEAVWQKYEQDLAKWWQEHPEAREAFHQDAGNLGLQWGWHEACFDDGGWKPMERPCMWNGIIDVGGAVWFRRQIIVPEHWAGQDLRLALGPIKDADVTWFNGEQIGATGGGNRQTYMIPRSYIVPARLVKAGPATIALRVFDQRGGGGFAGDENKITLSLASSVQAPASQKVATAPSTGPVPEKPMALIRGWKYKIERPLDPNDLKPFPSGMPYPDYKTGRSKNTIGCLYNGMIRPLMGFGFAGAAWYQGEFNTGRAQQYRTLLPAMIEDWRRAAGREFPFLIVQLPHHNGWMDWAELREAQAMTAKRLPNVGLVVTVDIWDADLHPMIKRPIGERLMLHALRVAYGENLVARGPIYKSIAIEHRKVRLSFDSIGGGLAINTAHPGAPEVPEKPELQGFSIAGSDCKFYPAKARIEGDTVVVWSDEVISPVAARYAFTNAACKANLCNVEGLPCGSFRTDDWPAQTTGKR